MFKHVTKIGLVVAGLLLMNVAVASADVSLGEVRVNPDSGLAGTQFTHGAVNVVTAYNTQVAQVQYAVTGGFTGTVTSTVWMNNAGELAFDYKLEITTIPTPPQVSPARSATIGGDWMPFKVYDVGAAGNGSSTGDWTDGDPVLLGRLGASGFGSPAVYWANSLVSKGTFLYAGDSSSNFWFTTDATSYTTSTFGVLDGGRTGDSFALVPVPAPGALLLGAAGLALAGWIKRRNA